MNTGSPNSGRSSFPGVNRRVVAVAALVGLLVPVAGLTPAGAVNSLSTQQGLEFETVDYGYVHSMALTPEGAIYAWGANWYGQLGDGTYEGRDSVTEVSVPGETFKAISAGDYHSLAIASDGSVFAWGANWEGQLGDGSTTDRLTPVEISVPGKTFLAISAGEEHSLALASDGSVYAWGNNSNGQLGDASTTNRNAPVEISVTGKTFSEISAGDGHSLALADDGSVYAWGQNSEGQLGDGTQVDRNVPVEISADGKTFSTLSAGGYYSMAVAADDSLWAWGANSDGQLGDATTTNRKTPVEISVAGENVSTISAGYIHSLATTSDGSLYAWGYNGSGQLADGTKTNRNSPHEVLVAGKTFSRVVAGGTQSMGVANDGSVYFWGSNMSGQLGLPVSSAIPIEAGGGKSFPQMSAGGFFSLALDSDGSLYSWGQNSEGQLGDGTATDRDTPVEVVVAGKTFSDISAGWEFSLALTTDGSLYSWGRNPRGQLGDGTEVDENVPVQVSDVGKSFSTMSAGFSHSLAITTDGDLYAWGNNSSGQLGDGTTKDRSSPVLVSELGFSAVSAGGRHSLALSSDGSLYAWGLNGLGQLGDGSTTRREVPVEIVVAGKTFSAIAAGRDHSLAIATDGSIYAWGNNSNGQLGDGSTTRRIVPVEIVVEDRTFSAIAAGEYHSLAIAADGSLHSWGANSYGVNSYGQLGDGSRTDRSSPVLVSVPGKTFSTVSAGDEHSLATTVDGSLLSWGYNSDGQLGNTSSAPRLVLQPRQINDLTFVVEESTSSTPVFSAPEPYAGPIVTDLSGSTVSAGDELRLSGQRLNTVVGITIDGFVAEISSQTHTSLTILIPAGMEPGVKSLDIASSFGTVTMEDMLRLLEPSPTEPEISNSSDTKGWTKQITDSQVKVYAKDIIGAGKVQFMLNGEEIAWVNADSEQDSKLRFVNGSNYLVRTVNLVEGQKNAIEVYLNGERIRRSAYSY